MHGEALALMFADGYASGFEAGAAEYNFCGSTNSDPEETK